VETFQLCKKDFNNSYSQFLDNANISTSNYGQIHRAVGVYVEYRKDVKLSCSDFLKIAEKHGHAERFLRSTLSTFLKFKDEFNGDYSHFLESTKVSRHDYGNKLQALEVYPEFKRELNYTIPKFTEILD